MPVPRSAAGVGPMTWCQRLERSEQSQVKPVPIPIAGMKAGQIMLVPTARQVDAFIRSIPPGESMSTQALRAALAAGSRAEVTCPITTGFHLRTVAEAAYERFQQGVPMAELTPFWRVLDAAAPTSRKLSFGYEFVRRQRAAEGLAP